LAQIVVGPGTNLCDLFPVGGLQGQRSTELRLTSSSAKIQDHLACDLQGHRRPKVVFNQSQRQVHAGCDSRGGVRVSIADVDGVGIDSYALEFISQLRRPFPMCRRALAVQKPRRSKQEGAGTDGADATHSLSDYLQPEK